MGTNIFNLDNFPFNKLALGNPSPLQNGNSYFVKLTTNDERPVYLQMPKSKTKNGVVETKRLSYIDILYDSLGNDKIFEWADNFEEKCKNMINEKKHIWFYDDITDEELDAMMSPILRTYKAGSKLLLRTYIKNNVFNKKCIVYDEDENIKELKDITVDKTIIPLIHVSGIKFTSKSIELKLSLSQTMILNDNYNENNKCLIQRKSTINNFDNNSNTLVETEKITEAEPQPEPQPEAEPQPQPEEIIEQLTEVSNVEVETDTETDSELIELDELIKQKASNIDISSQLITENENREVLENNNENNIISKNNEQDEELEIEYDELLCDNIENENELKEINLEISSNIEDTPLSLKKPNEVYHEIYRAAREKAKKMKQQAIEAYLEVNEIKKKYMIEDLDDSDDEFSIFQSN